VLGEMTEEEESVLGEMTEEGEKRGEEGGDEEGALGCDWEGSLPRFRSFRLGIRGEGAERQSGCQVVPDPTW
jgi:predicted transposase YdaD